MTCGIYLGSPKNGKTDKVYIGQSVDICGRVRRHNNDMLNGKHSPKMQAAYAEFGEFEWEILAECAKEHLDELERFYIKLFDAVNNGFNTYADSNSAPVLYGLDNGKVDNDKILLYKIILDLTLANPSYTRYKIAELANTEPHIVAHIWYGQSCSWLNELFPTEYAAVINLTGNRQIGGKTAEQQGISYPVLLSPELLEYTVTNIREFARKHDLDQGDLSNVLNQKVASTKGWIIKDLDVINTELHAKFYSTRRGHYKRQFDLYKANHH